jgi:hypothetical protein
MPAPFSRLVNGPPAQPAVAAVIVMISAQRENLLFVISIFICLLVVFAFWFVGQRVEQRICQGTVGRQLIEIA